MNRTNRHIKTSAFKAIESLARTSIVLACILWFIQSGSLKAQVINNDGAFISVTGGTFVQGDTLENTSGTITNNGTIQLNGHYINIGTTKGTGIYNLKGNWINTGTFTPESSTVRFNGSSFQLVQSNGDPFFHFILNNTGTGVTNRLILSDNVTVSDSLDLVAGNIQTDGNILYLEEQTPTSLTYSSTTGSRVIGKFERGINATDKYLFPLGSDDYYNPMNLNFNAVQNQGSVLSEFIASDPDSIGLPLPDPGYVNPADTVEVYDADSIGYWSVKANNGFASNDYDVNLKGSGFSEVQNASRIIKRPAPGGDWMLDGIHKDGVDSIAYRNVLTAGIDNSNGNEFGWGHIRPRIQTQPKDTAVCDGESATFYVGATGRGDLTYEWEVLAGAGPWQAITDNATYANSNTKTLLIIAADLSMDGYKYRVIVRDSLGNFHPSNAQATLTVSPNPVATATPQQDTICNGDETYVVLTSDVPGTTFDLEVLYDGSGFGATTTLDGDTIKQILTNTSLFADSVVYRIFPTGPTYPYCGGTADTVVIWVEPTVIITALDDTLCDNTPTGISVSSNNITTNGMRFTWVVTPNANINGEVNSNAIGQIMGTSIVQTLDNTSAMAQLVTYTITPWTIDNNGNNKCSGTPIDIDIWVEPTPVITSVNDTLCDLGTTSIAISSTNTVTNPLGVYYTWTVQDLNNPGEITGYSTNNSGISIGTAITDPLDNHTDIAKKITYQITPWTLDNNDDLKCNGSIINIDIWINPTPNVASVILDDTICNDTRTHITLTTTSVLTSGIVTFDYTYAADIGLTGSFVANNRTDGYIIEDSLHNASSPASPLVVRYTITPRALSIGCADGTSITDSITVHPTPDTYFDFTNYQTEDSVTCNGDSDAFATIEAQNGINIFTYLWNDPSNQTDSIAKNLAPGIYIVTVTDNQGCTKTDSITIKKPDILYTPADSVKDVTCFGANDGYARVLPIGGNGAYTYIWDPTGATTRYINNINGGAYKVTVTDYKGCAKDTTFYINEDDIKTASLSKDDITCFGDNNGTAKVLFPTGTYSWSNTSNNQEITGLSKGDYSVTIIYSGSCIASGEITINEPEPLTSTIETKSISCAGDADGTADITVLGGNSILPYTFNWFTSDGTGLNATSEDQTGLSGGHYYVTVSDYKGCSVLDTAIIGEPPLFTTDLSYGNVNCYGEGNGWINLNVQGGNGTDDYSFEWSSTSGGSYANTSYLSLLSAAKYFVTIKDSLNCEIDTSVTITEPDLLTSTISQTNITCNGYEDGTAKLDVDGGNGGYAISWSNGASVDSIYALSAGNYSVEITDIKGCVASNDVDITEPDAIDNQLSFENINCFGFGNGQISLSPKGGTSPYNYIWSHDNLYTNNVATNLNPGTYTISVIDNNSCLQISTVDITQPDPLIANVLKNDITCFGDDDGYISISLTGGTPDYTYNWSNGYSESSADMLTKGVYSIVIKDLHQCEVDTSVEILEPEKLVISPVFRRPTCPDIKDGYVELNITGGIEPYNIYWDNGSPEESLYDIRSGIYDVLIEDQNLCNIDTSFTIRSAHDFCFDIASAFTPNKDNINDKWVIEMNGLYPHVEVEVFDRWGTRVFYSKGYEESQYWDGTYKGKDLPMDTYYYIIYLKNGMNRISGTVTLIR